MDSPLANDYSARSKKIFVALGLLFLVLIPTCRTFTVRFKATLDLTLSSNLRNKAVADGAVSFYLDRFVKTRVAKITYGVDCNIPYQSSIPDHKARHRGVFVGLGGRPRLHHSFSVLLSRVSWFPMPRGRTADKMSLTSLFC